MMSSFAGFHLLMLLSTPLKVLIFFGGVPLFVFEQRALDKELKVVVPVENKEVVKAGDVILLVNAQGLVKMDGEMLTQKELSDKLTDMVKKNKDLSVCIRASGKTEYKKIVQIIDVCRKAQIHNVSFATQAQRKQPSP